MRMARIARAARILVTMALLWLLWSRLDGPAALRQLAGADPGWLGGALLALTAQTILSAWRWRLTARGLGQSIPPGRALSEYYLAQILNQTLPGGMLGDAGRAVRARAEAGLRRAAEAVVLERLAGQAGLLALMLAGILLAVLLPGGPALPAPVLATAGALFLIAISLAAAIAAAPRRPGRAGRAAIGLRQSIGRALVGRHVLPAQITLSLGTAAANLLAFDFCARATGTVLGPVATLALVPLVLFTMVLPVTISGWGLREGAAAALFPLVSASAAAGLAASVAFGFMVLAAALPGVAVFAVSDRRSGPTPAATATACPERPSA